MSSTKTSENAPVFDWAGSRGERWRRQLPGMEATLRPVDAPLIEALALDAPLRIADVGCGGGGTTLAIRERAPEGSVVHGYDLSPALVDAARSRIRPGDDAMAFEVADMATASPPGAPYDRLVSRFGVMFFDDPDGAFANLVRWLVPGGRFAFAVWGRPVDNPWMSNVREAVAEVAPLPQVDPDAPGPFRYAEARSLVAALERAGFRGVEVRTVRTSLAIGGGLPSADAAAFAIASFATFADILAAAGDEASRAALESLRARYARHEHGGVVALDGTFHLVTGGRA